MYQVLLEIFHHMEVKLILVSLKKKKGKGVKRRGVGISCFIKDIECNGVSLWKEMKEKKKERILNLMVE